MDKKKNKLFGSVILAGALSVIAAATCCVAKQLIKTPMLPEGIDSQSTAGRLLPEQAMKERE